MQGWLKESIKQGGRRPILCLFLSAIAGDLAVKKNVMPSLYYARDAPVVCARWRRRNSPGRVRARAFAAAAAGARGKCVWVIDLIFLHSGAAAPTLKKQKLEFIAEASCY